MIIIFGAVIYTEFTNCLMYIGPTSVNLDNFCMLLCIIPMLSSATVECRLFTYFLLMRERLNVINQSIDFYRNNLNSAWDKSSHNDNIDKMNGIKSKVFFIAELIGSNKINERVMTKTDNGRKSNCAAKLKSMTLSFWRFIKNLLNVRKHKIFVDNFDAAFKHPKNNFHPRNQNYMERVYSMQIIYSKLYEISDLISKAYGIQIIAIISVQFITLTTLLYYSTMKVIRYLLIDAYTNFILCSKRTPIKMSTPFCCVTASPCHPKHPLKHPFNPLPGTTEITMNTELKHSYII